MQYSQTFTGDAMRLERTKDILAHAQEFHRLIATAYHNLDEKYKHERLHMLLSYLEAHEKHLGETLNDYSSQARQKVLNAWFRMSPCEAKLAELKKVLSRDDITEDKIIALAIGVDDCMIEMYKSLARATDDTDVRDLFQDLASLEEHEKRRMVRDAMRFQDI